MPDWLADHAALTAADREHGLAAEDLERLAVAAFVIGRDDDVVPLRERALQLYLERGELERAVRCGFWCGFHLQNRGEWAQAQGWAERLTRLVPAELVETFAGMACQAVAVRAMLSGDAAAALPLFEQSAALADRDGDPDMFVLAGLGRARCLHLVGRDGEATAAMDEVMVHIVAGRVAPQVSGLGYCSVIDLCLDWFDLARAHEWTRALSAWVDEQHGMVPYRGSCLVHRAEILQLRGSWEEAAREAEAARDQLHRSGEGAVAAAHYRVAELARLRGRLDVAEEAYACAAGHGYEAQPGLARLRFAQGRADAAVAGLRRALAEASPPQRARPEQLAALVEIGLAADAVDVARAACAELSELVAGRSEPFLVALAERACGAVLLADGDPGTALPRLRRAAALWLELDATYDTACTRMLLARACRELGDHDGAAMMEAAARTELTRLGASGAPRPAGPLSPREHDVLRLVATGASNRAIATQLVLSEKTVARHVSNILGKLGLPSRAAATAYAFERGLV